jgi:hypothetical protein
MLLSCLGWTNDSFKAPNRYNFSLSDGSPFFRGHVNGSFKAQKRYYNSGK